MNDLYPTVLDPLVAPNLSRQAPGTPETTVDAPVAAGGLAQAPESVETGPERAADATPEPSAEPAPEKAPGRTKGVALGGKAPEIPTMPPAPEFPDVDPLGGYVPDEEFDAADLSKVNLELNRCRSRIFRVSQFQREAQRRLAIAEMEYSRQMRRALIQTSGGTAETRKAIAELHCEPWEDAVAVARQVVEEMRKRAQDVRDDLKAVENLSHNARAQMDIR